MSFSTIDTRCLAAVVLAGALIVPSVGFATDYEIRTSRTNFESATQVVRVGDTITWVRDDPVLHEIDFVGDPTGVEGKPLYRRLEHKPVTITAGIPGLHRYACKWHGLFGFLEILP
jgi:plastocyanin